MLCLPLTNRIVKLAAHSRELFMSKGSASTVSTVRLAASPLALDIATIDRFLAHSHRRRYPARTDVFRPETRLAPFTT